MFSSFCSPTKIKTVKLEIKKKMEERDRQLFLKEKEYEENLEYENEDGQYYEEGSSVDSFLWQFFESIERVKTEEK